MPDAVSEKKEVKKTNVHVAMTLWVFHLILGAVFLTKNGNASIFNWAAAMQFFVSFFYMAAVLRQNFIMYKACYIFMEGWLINYTLPLFYPFEIYASNVDSLAYAVQAAFFALVMVMLGFYIGPGVKMLRKNLPLKNFSLNDEALARLPGKMYPLWIITYIAAAKELIAGQFSYIISALSTLSIFASLMIDAYLYLSVTYQQNQRAKKRKHLMRAGFFFLVYLASCFLSGFSGTMIVPLFLFIVIYFKTRGKLPVFFIASLIVFIMVFLGFIVPFTKAFRVYYWEKRSLSESINNAIADLNASKEESGDGYLKTIGRAANPLQMATVCYTYSKNRGSINLYADPLDFLARFVPRFIWSEKKAVDYNYIGRELGLLGQDDYATSVGITLLAGFIMGGLLHVIVGMFLVGLVLRIYWEWLVVRAEGNFFAFGIYLILMYSWSLGADEFFVMLHSNISFLIYVYMMAGVLKKIR